MAARGELPRWVDVGVIPLLNLFLALLATSVIFLLINENPLECLGIMINGAVGSVKGWSYLLYYATNFIFTGLCVAVAFHAGLFNIGGEGQAYFAGLGAAIVGLNFEFLPWPLLIPLAVIASILFGGLLGLGSGLSAGQARQPYCHHHHHVQLHCLQPDGLSDQLLVPSDWQDGSGKPWHRLFRFPEA